MLLWNWLKTQYAKKKVLVTGGAGFIGSNLIKQLIKLEAKVTVLDNFSSGRVNNLKAYLHKITLLKGNVFDDDILKFLLQQNFFAIFHLAAVSSVPWAESNKEYCEKTNVESISKILKILESQNKQSCIIFSSSSAVYGETNNPCCENQQANPCSTYAKSKHKGELLLSSFAEKNKNAQCFSLRYFNVFGKNDKSKIRFGSVIPIFKKLLKNDKPLPIFGNGMNQRDYVSVEKVVLANIILPFSKLTGHHIFNVASGTSCTTLELIEKLSNEIQRKKPKLTFLPSRQGDVLRSLANCEKFELFLTNFLKELSA